uniref:ShTK domain protein n=1 Tax=Rhabditophanes sp. KR3021 TaxID=114890 RepID=A0AC35TIE5_9BILA
MITFVQIQNSGHSGPAFSGWHREYLKRAEITMKLIDPSLSIPYWDSVLDNYLPNPADSIIFSSLFYGEAGIGGWVVNGPFANWHTLEGHASLQRNLGRKGHLFTENNINNALAANHVENFLAYTAPLGGCPVASFFGALEYSHASIHLFCGGDFEPISTSANDPIFFNHHAFVDLVWENWRLSHQNRFQREHDYPRDMPQCSNFQHFSTSPMRPFPILNRDGLSNAYTDNLYSYAPRPMCSPNNPNCGSQYLFCDTRGYAHCVSKVKLGGMCQGFEGFDVCFGGNCFNGRCVPRQMAGPMGPQQNFNNQFVTRNRHRNDAIEDNSMTDIDNLIPQANVSVSALICLNHDPCCSIWAAIGECDSNLPYMHRYCRRSCGDCSPTKIADAKGCVDRHVSCKFWSEHGLCSSRKQFMYENCRVSCNKCEESVEKLCRDISIETGHPKELNKPLTTTTIKPTLSIQKELVEKKKEEDLE